MSASLTKGNTPICRPSPCLKTTEWQLLLLLLGRTTIVSLHYIILLSPDFSILLTWSDLNTALNQIGKISGYLID